MIIDRERRRPAFQKFSRRNFEKQFQSIRSKITFPGEPQARESLDLHNLKIVLHDLIQSCNIERDEINRTKSFLGIRNFENNTWRDYGVQLILPYSENKRSLLDQIFEVKIRLVLMDVYELIYLQGMHGRSVFKGLKELVEENNLTGDFSHVLTNPIRLALMSYQMGAKDKLQNYDAVLGIIDKSVGSD